MTIELECTRRLPGGRSCGNPTFYACAACGQPVCAFHRVSISFREYCGMCVPKG